MKKIVISTEPVQIGTDLPNIFVESPSASTYLVDEEASKCPLLFDNKKPALLRLAHPLAPSVLNENSIVTLDASKAETSSSSESSFNVHDKEKESAPSNLFGKHNYQNLQNNNKFEQDKGNLSESGSTPLFLSWNWPLIRKCTLLIFISAVLVMCAAVVTVIITLPQSCNPKSAWYRGGVFYEIFVPSFQDSNNDGIGDVVGLSNQIDYIASMGFSAIRMNSIFPSKNYPKDFNNITSLIDVSPVIGTIQDIEMLLNVFHARNVSVLLDLPLNQYISVKHDQALIDITNALQFWKEKGFDGFYMKGLENLTNYIDVQEYLMRWKNLLGNHKILLVNENFLSRIPKLNYADVLNYVDLIDVHLDVSKGIKFISEQIQTMLKVIPQKEDSAWIHWSINRINNQTILTMEQMSKLSLATSIVQLMLPGTPNIIFGDEMANEKIKGASDESMEIKTSQHLSAMFLKNTTLQSTQLERQQRLPKAKMNYFKNFNTLANMIRLRDYSPSLYKNAICKTDSYLPNTQLRIGNNNILVIERTYPRRHTFVSITNLSHKNLSFDLTSMFYSGYRMLTNDDKDKIFFKQFKIDSIETIVVKLDK